MIILDEMDYAEKVLNKKTYPVLKDLIILAKYFKYLGYSQEDIKNSLFSFCKERDSDWNEIRKGWKIKKALEESEKYNLRIPVPTPITKRELEEIGKVNDYNKEKFLFVLLVYAKFLKYNNTRVNVSKKPRTIGLYYVKEDMIKILQQAGVKSNKKYRNALSHNLYEMGFIDGTRFNDFVVKYVHEDSPSTLFVSDYENIVLEYQRYKGERVVGCSCGRLFLKKNSRRSLCPKCVRDNRLENWRKYQRTRYEKKVFSTEYKTDF